MYVSLEGTFEVMDDDDNTHEQTEFVKDMVNLTRYIRLGNIVSTVYS
jgi:hypothetical protein